MKLRIPNFRIPDFPLGALFVTVLFAIGLLFASPDLPSAWLWEVIVAVAFIVWAIGAGFSPPPQTKAYDIEQQESEAGDKARPPRQEISDGASGDLTPLIDAIRAEGRANRAEERKEDGGKQRREQITIALLAVTMGAVILQVREMVKVYEPIRDQAKAALDQAKAAETAAEAATKQSENSDKALIESERAWAGAAGAKLNGAISAGAEVKVIVSTRNSGREPATNFTWTMLPLVSADEGAMSAQVNNYVKTCFSSPSVPGRQVLWPSTGFGTGFDFTSVFRKEQIDDAATKGDKVLVIEGCLAYDTFGVTHHSTFCYFFKNGVTPPDNWNLCFNGSFAD